MKEQRIDIVPNGYVCIKNEGSALYWFDQVYKLPTPLHVELKHNFDIKKIVQWIDSEVPLCASEIAAWGSQNSSISNPFTKQLEMHSPRPVPLKCKSMLSELPSTGLQKDIKWSGELRNSLVEFTNGTNCTWSFLSLSAEIQSQLLQEWFFELDNIDVAFNHHEHGYLLIGEKRVIARFVDDEPGYAVVSLGKVSD